MKRIPVIAGNWKMNKTLREAVDFARALKSETGKLSDRICVVCPAFVGLAAVSQELSGSGILVGAQNLFWENDGAFTGEISARMIKDVGASFVIIGHSERRKILNETDDRIHQKISRALSGGLQAIVCVGETLDERERNVTFEVIKRQVTQAFEGLKKEDLLKCIVAYEPVWAIGTGRNATPSQAEEVHAYIRGLLAQSFGHDAAQSIIIQYGGSVKPDNINDLMAQPDIDGALVGGASLDVKSFLRILQFKVNGNS